MERSSKELRQAWVGSILFHIIVAVILFFTSTAGSLPEVQFVEMTWGASSASLATVPTPAIETGAPAPGSTQPPAGADNTVDLPVRSNIASPEEVLNIPATKKTDVNEGPSSAPARMKTSTADTREPSVAATKLGSKEDLVGKTSAPASQVSAPAGSGTIGSSLGEDVSYAIQWSGGGERQLLKGDLPKYPAGVNLNAQIRLRVVVQPRGTIKAAQPLQKGDTRLENAALKEVRSWRFESLQQGQPALGQVCTITFNFKLK